MSLRQAHAAWQHAERALTVPELPEVETTRRGILQRLQGRRVVAVTLRETRLRWPVAADLGTLLANQSLLDVGRRGKYLLLDFGSGTLLAHLGMSGSLRVLASAADPVRKHDHVEIQWDDGSLLRYHDPRRFGALLWIEGDPLQHQLLAGLGIEPLGVGFDGDYLYRASRGRHCSIKQLLMDGKAVVGVGNIYASEALFIAGVDPRQPADRIAPARYCSVAMAVREVLQAAIAQGGTTLRDYVDGNGVPGHFALRLEVYGRAGQPCRRCGKAVRTIRQAQRSTFFCPHCQR